ncbi:hypothetical protein Y032_0079g1237 [Ancylostoma ceylanicum]|uniref:Uncharacterized protein n=1 Tax=Ancylostoma ceylanicum TaxID=53326 RepID=A0A016TTA1_9BILA|nr:hypothetical protein Y032_0079g1237 [Ancylostoma ceylanicum]
MLAKRALRKVWKFGVSRTARLVTYLKHFFLQNTQGDDLWKALDEALAESKEGAIEGPDGGELKMWYFGSQWSKQMGFPIVTLDTLNSTTVKIGQRRYLKGSYVLELQKYRNTSYGYKWDVPLFCQLGGKYLGMKWLKKDEPLYLNIGREESPIVVNVDRQGYFRQNYDGRGWKNIIEQLKKDHEVCCDS